MSAGPPTPPTSSPKGSPASSGCASPGAHRASPPGPHKAPYAAPTASLVPPPVPVPPFAAVRLGPGGLRQRLAMALARQRRRVLLCAVLVLALLLPVLGHVARAPEGTPAAGSGEAPGAEPGEVGSTGGSASAPRPGAAEGPAGGSGGGSASVSPSATSGDTDDSPRLVSAPVRIADADAVRLLRPGDLVDVLASPPEAAASTRARLVAHRARVTKLPSPQGSKARGEEIVERGGLVVLAVPPRTARDLAGAGAHSQLAVAVWEKSEAGL